MTRRRVVASGIAIACVYIVALGCTVAMRDARVRPLYDGFAPPPAYSWVDPPAFWAAGNVEPASVTAVVALGHRGSVAAGVATPDGQFVIDLGVGAIAAHALDREVKVMISPVDPKRLAEVPLGLRANGNAYRVAMTYLPSRVAVPTVADPGSLLVELPEVGDHLFRSRDGRGWSTLTAHVVSQSRLSLTAVFGGPGYYLAATNLPELAGPSARSSHRSLGFGIAVAALAAVLLLGAFALRRRRPHSSATD